MSKEEELAEGVRECISMLERQEATLASLFKDSGKDIVHSRYQAVIKSITMYLKTIVHVYERDKGK